MPVVLRDGMPAAGHRRAIRRDVHPAHQALGIMRQPNKLAAAVVDDGLGSY